MANIFPGNRITRLVRVFGLFLVLNSLWTMAWTLVFTSELVYHPPTRLSQGLAALGLSLDLYFWANAIPLLIMFLSHFVVAVLLFLRLPHDRMAFFVAIFLLAFGTANAYPLAPEFLEVWSSGRLYYVIPFAINNFLAWPLLVTFFALYPDGRFLPHWMRYVAVYCFFFSSAWGAFPQVFGAPAGWLGVFVLVSVILVFGSSLYAQVYRYRYYSTPLQRQQTKWMVYGVAVMVVAIIGQQLLTALVLPYSTATPAESVVLDLISMLLSTMTALVPIAVGLAILRYRLYDIDIIINRTLVYGTLTAALALVYFGSVVLLQALFRTATGQAQSEVVTVISTLTIAALFTPLRHRIQALIDHRFYRRKYDAARTLAVFSTAARDVVDLEQLTAELIYAVEETMQPAHTSLWLRPAEKEKAV
jgi:hypothetical protein